MSDVWASTTLTIPPVIREKNFKNYVEDQGDKVGSVAHGGLRSLRDTLRNGIRRVRDAVKPLHDL